MNEERVRYTNEISNLEIKVAYPLFVRVLEHLILAEKDLGLTPMVGFRV